MDDEGKAVAGDEAVGLRAPGPGVPARHLGFLEVIGRVFLHERNHGLEERRLHKLALAGDGARMQRCQDTVAGEDTA